MMKPTKRERGNGNIMGGMFKVHCIPDAWNFNNEIPSYYNV
jgi:hypothetical protein